MSAALSIDLRDGATPAIQRIIANTRPRAVARVVMRPLEKLWGDKLKKFPRLPGKFQSFPATGFGEAAARSVKAEFTGDAVALRAGATADTQGLRQRYYGGQIPRDGSRRLLIFGIKPESYGKRPSDFGWQPRQPGESRRSGFGYAARQRVRELFAFVMGPIHQSGNPALMPSDQEIRDTCHAAIGQKLYDPAEAAT